MKIHSIWKNVMVLTFGALIVFQAHAANSDSTTNSTNTDSEECVITEDQQ